MLLESLHPDAARLPEHTAQKVVAYGEKRLIKYSVHSLPILNSRTASLQTSIHPKQLQVGRLLGQGSFSSAYEITSLGGEDEGSSSSEEQPKPQRLALKVLQPKLIEKPALFAGCAADLVREGIIMSKLNHVNVLQCHALGGESVQAFGSGRHDAVFLVLERLDSTLKEKLLEWRQQASSMDPPTTASTTASTTIETTASSSSKPKKKKKTMADHVLFLLSGGKHRRMQHSLMSRTDILCELAEAIRYLHSNRIMHRDLKPDNLGVVVQADGTMRLKVFDLDVCRILPPEVHINDYQTFRLTRNVGSPRYMAPEVARGEDYNAKADVYSFGLLAYEILSLKKPFSEIPSKELNNRVCHEGARPHCPASWPRSVVSLIHRCWSDQIQQRPTMAQIKMELRDTLDRMCPATEVKLRKQQQQHSSQSSDLFNKRRFIRRGLEESRTHRSESTIEVSQISQ